MLSLPSSPPGHLFLWLMSLTAITVSHTCSNARRLNYVRTEWCDDWLHFVINIRSKLC
jgi:hypothetical protein